MDWFVIYEDAPQTENIIVARDDKAAVDEFDSAAKAGHIAGRKVMGMWLVNKASEQVDVVRIYGYVPIPMKQRHQNYLDKEK